jgi:type II secretory pathway predicted ATPase ExeA/cell division septation protein DedD
MHGGGATLTYEPFFGLTEKPFSLNADPRFVFDSPAYESTRKGLLAGIRRREGLVVLTGEIGTGKTTLCRSVLRDLGRNTYSSLVPDPFAAREDLLKMLLIDFGVMSIQDLTTGSLRQASRTELGYLLSDFLDGLGRETFAVVIIDEAQNLSLPLIEETRILFDTFGATGRLQIVFVGQPELHAKLKLPEMRQVDQRVCGYHRLAPMSRDAVPGYIQHRLEVAGGRRDRVLFPLAIVDALHRRTGGVPRLINRVCDRALHLAYERKAEAVDLEIIETALIEIGSATLSPTWDSIVFAETPAPALSTAPAPAVAPAPAPAPIVQAAAAVAAAPQPAPLEEAEDFQKQIDSWVEKDLGPSSRMLTPLPAGLADATKERRPVARTAPKREVRPPRKVVTTDWPRDVRSETYMQRFLRVWAKRAALAVAALAVANVALVGASLLPAMLTPTQMPDTPKAPEKTVPGIALPATTPVQSPASAAPVAAASVIAAASAGAAAAVPGDYLVAVGLFASRERADHLVDALTHAGLPAMQRPSRLRRRDVQQVVLGPFFSRADAVADLRRLQALGGYEDASVIDQ